ncbi:DsrE family protein [uncultured Campylobacter sp.]|uniref:DsrE family protein n=1 Tax=uncultured Campylobacter sp. TaxID=218934 RepID=UPI002607A4BF|nr:DsrE family protein [uncultured Campylobacter sp.]
MKILLILANQPYNGSDNALRLADSLHKKSEEVRIFLMNDTVDLVIDSTEKPGNYDIDLIAELKELYRGGVALKVCGNC